jgi:hypothetical protein
VAWGRWTKRITVTVRADFHTVVAWFQHPDRAEEMLAEMAKRGMTDCSIEDSFTDTVRIRDIRCKTPKGSAVHARAQTELGPDGHVGVWSGDRFVVRAHGFNQGPNTAGRQETKDWDEIREFVATGEGMSEIRLRRHEQLVDDPRWYEWLLPPITERAQLKRGLQNLVLRCEEAQRSL